MTISTNAGFLALAAVGFISSAPAHALPSDDTPQAQPGRAEVDRISPNDDIVVAGQAYEQELESPKRVRPVRDTPQTVTVLTNEVIEQQNLLTLRDVLSTVPGITFGAGEGGGGYGDSITLRGYSANTDITVDGVRDSAQYSRTDPFNLEQVEVTNGANSVISGAGSVGGNINIVTKRPQAQDRRTVSVGGGTDNYVRATADINQRVADNIAVRLNAMFHHNDVPGRDWERFHRWGVAPAVTIGIDTPTRLILQYVHQEDDNIPQYGVPYYQNAFNDGALPGVGRKAYFGNRNVDTQQVNLDQFTATFEHDVNDKVSVRNLARFQDVRQFSRVSPPQGTYCLSTGVTPTGTTCPATAAGTGPTPADYYFGSGPRGNTRDSKNLLMFDQVDVRAVFDTGPIEHTLDVGGAATWERFDLSTGNWMRTAAGATVSANYLINIADPNNVVQGPAGFAYGSNYWTGAVNFIPTAAQFGEQENFAAYLFDAMKLGKVELNGGVRIEHNDGSYRADTIAGATATSRGTVTRGTTVHNSDTLFSYRVGLVYKPVEAVSLYVAYGNSKTPSKSSVNGSCVQAVTNSTCNVDPEGTKNYEVGAKAEVFNGRLLLSAAAFRNDRDKYRVASNDPTIPDQVLDGHSRVDGIALSASGNITRAWQVTANYTYLDSTLIQSVSDFCRANPLGTGCSGNAGFPDPAADSELTQTPRHSGSLFTTYRLPFGLSVGYGFTYQGSFALNSPALTTVGGVAQLTPVYRSDDYIVHNGYIAYEVSPNLSFQLNVKNIGDKEYYTRIRNNGWATPGDGRAAILSATARF